MTKPLNEFNTVVNIIKDNDDKLHESVENINLRILSAYILNHIDEMSDSSIMYIKDLLNYLNIKTNALYDNVFHDFDDRQYVECMSKFEHKLLSCMSADKIRAEIDTHKQSAYMHEHIQSLKDTIKEKDCVIESLSNDIKIHKNELLNAQNEIQKLNKENNVLVIHKGSDIEDINVKNNDINHSQTHTDNSYSVYIIGTLCFLSGIVVSALFVFMFRKK